MVAQGVERLAAAVEQLEYPVHTQHHAAAFRLAHDARQVDRAFTARHHIQADQDIDIDAEAINGHRALQSIDHVVTGNAQAMRLRQGAQHVTQGRELLFLRRAIAVGQLQGHHHLLIDHVAPGLELFPFRGANRQAHPAHRLASARA